MDPEYGARYSDLYERHWWWRAREAWIVDRLTELVPPGGFGSILDVGCGDGLSFAALAGFGQPQGVEADSALVSARGRASGKIHVGPFDARFDPGRHFGLITMLDVLEHLDDDVAALAHAARLLDPGGVILITVPAHEALWTSHDDYNHHRRRYSVSSLARLAQEAGVNVRASGRIFNWLAPLKLLVRVKEKFYRGPSRLPEVPPAAVNRLLYGICRLEHWTWGRVPWLAGSSLFAVCENRFENRGAATAAPTETPHAAPKI